MANVGRTIDRTSTRMEEFAQVTENLKRIFTDYGVVLKGIDTGISDLSKTFEGYARLIPPTITDIGKHLQMLEGSIQQYRFQGEMIKKYTDQLDFARSLGLQNTKVLEDNIAAHKAMSSWIGRSVKEELNWIGTTAKAAIQATIFQNRAYALLGTMFFLQFGLGGVAKRFDNLAKKGLTLQSFLEDIDWVFEDIADSLMDALEPAFDALAYPLEVLADLIEDQPDFVKAFLGAIILLVPLLLTFLSGVAQLAVGIYALSAIGGLSGLFKMFGSAITTAGSSIKGFLSLPLKDTLLGIGHGIKGVITDAWDWIKTIPSFIKGMFTANASSLTLGQTIGILAIGVAALIGTFMIVDQLLSGLDPAIRKPVAAIVALIAAIVAATVAWMAFHGTVTVGVAVPIILAAVGAGIAGIKALVGMEKGGIIKAPTLALLGESGAEMVTPLPKGQSTGMTTEPPTYITNNFYGYDNPKEMARKVYDELDKLKREKMKNKIY